VLAFVLAEADEILTEGGFELSDIDAEVFESDGVAGRGLLEDGTRLRIERDVGRRATVDPDLDLLFEGIGAFVSSGGTGLGLEGLIDHVVNRGGLDGRECAENRYFGTGQIAVTTTTTGRGVR